MLECQACTRRLWSVIRRCVSRAITFSQQTLSARLAVPESSELCLRVAGLQSSSRRDWAGYRADAQSHLEPQSAKTAQITRLADEPVADVNAGPKVGPQCWALPSGCIMVQSALRSDSRAWFKADDWPWRIPKVNLWLGSGRFGRDSTVGRDAPRARRVAAIHGWVNDG